MQFKFNFTYNLPIFHFVQPALCFYVVCCMVFLLLRAPLIGPLYLTPGITIKSHVYDSPMQSPPRRWGSFGCPCYCLHFLFAVQWVEGPLRIEESTVVYVNTGGLSGTDCKHICSCLHLESAERPGDGWRGI